MINLKILDSLNIWSKCPNHHIDRSLTQRKLHQSHPKKSLSRSRCQRGGMWGLGRTRVPHMSNKFAPFSWRAPPTYQITSPTSQRFHWFAKPYAVIINDQPNPTKENEGCSGHVVVYFARSCTDYLRLITD